MNITNKILTVNTSIREEIDLTQCILCQSNKSEYLSSGEKGRTNLLNAAKNIPDDIRSKRLIYLTEHEVTLIKYHSVSCYSTFVKASKRSRVSTDVDSAATSDCPQTSPANTRVKRLKTSEKNICIICGSNRVWNSVTHQHEYNLYRVSEEPKNY